jgi:phosphate transport system substrate-binding protein
MSKFLLYNTLLALISIVFLMGCNQKAEPVLHDTPTSGTITISVDESFKPIIEAQIQVFEATNPGTKINAIYKPEAECIKDLYFDSATRLVIITRGLTYIEAKVFGDSLAYVPRSDKVANDAIAVIVNRKSNDTTFTLNDLQGQLTGLLKNNKKIVFDGLNATSAIRFAIDSILKGKPFDLDKVRAVKNSKEVLDFVASDTNAIGFVGFSWIGNPEDTAQVNMLKKVKIAYVQCKVCVDSPFVKPTQASIANRRYPLTRGLYYILKENYSGLGSGFASFLQYERGQLVFRRGYLSPAQMSFKIRNVHVTGEVKKE